MQQVMLQVMLPFPLNYMLRSGGGCMVLLLGPTPRAITLYFNVTGRQLHERLKVYKAIDKAETY